MELLGTPDGLYKERRCWDSIDPDNDPHLIHNDASSWLHWSQPNKAGHDSYWEFHHWHTCICATQKTQIAMSKEKWSFPVGAQQNCRLPLSPLRYSTGLGHVGPEDFNGTWQEIRPKYCISSNITLLSIGYVNDCNMNVAQGDYPTQSTRHSWCAYERLGENNARGSADDSRQPDAGQGCLWWCRQFVQVHAII